MTKHGKHPAKAAADVPRKSGNPHTNVKSGPKSGPNGPHVDDIRTVDFSEDGRLMLSASSDGSAKLWRSQAGGQPAELCCSFHSPEPISCASCSPVKTGWKRCKVATCGGDGKLRIWQFSLEASFENSAYPVKTIDAHSDVVWACAFNPIDERQVSTCSSDTTVRTWDITSGECVAEYYGHTSWVTWLTYNHGATLLASTSKDCSIRLWDATKPGVQVMEIWGHESWVTCACFTPNSAFLFSASHDKTVRQWNLAHGLEVARLHGHAGPVQSVAVSSDGLMMASTGWDGTCRLWSLRMRKLLCVLPLGSEQPKQRGAIGIAPLRGLAVSISPHGHIVVGGSHGELRDFFAPPSLTKSLGEELSKPGPKDANKDKGVAPVGWVVDMIVELHQKDSAISDFMLENCGIFKIAGRLGKATPEQYSVHQHYSEEVLNFMEQVCDDLNIDHDDFERAVHVLSQRDDQAAHELVQEMDAVEDFALFFSIMSLKRIEHRHVHDSDPEEEEEGEGGSHSARGTHKAKKKGGAQGGRKGGSGSGVRESQMAVVGLLEDHHGKVGGKEKQGLAARASMRASLAKWEESAQHDSTHHGHWEQVANEIQQEKEAVERRYAEQQKKIEELLSRVADSEKRRAQLHEQVQELRGNIRVFCRMRPLLPSENSEPADVKFDNTGDRPALSLALLVGNRKTPLRFNFDQVFRLEASQQQVYKEVEPLMQSVMDGYKVCVFAYGQTGSGKTFTMEGEMGDGKPRPDDKRGVMPRCIQRLLAMRDEYKKTGDWAIKVSASCIEIYNESIRDLLSDDDSGKKHEVLTEQETGETYVSDATVVPVATESEIFGLVRGAAKRRETHSTVHNAVSSRSHQVLQIRVQLHNKQTGEKMLGILNLVDLAGSERVTDQHDEFRLKEAQAINKSLSCLLGVILAIATKQGHVPFRNSKLTHVLQSSLTGHGKAIMFANISPKAEHVSETANTLRFATQVSSVQLGTGKHSNHATAKK